MTSPEPKVSEPKFEVLTGAIQPRITIVSYGLPRSGKTWLALSAPGDIGVISLDSNCRPICEKYARMNPDKKIHFVEFMRSPLALVESINELKRHFSNIRDTYYRMLEMKSTRTVIIDSASQLWEDVRLAYVGREKPDQASEIDDKGNPTGKRITAAQTRSRDLGEPKREIREMVGAAENKNLVLISRGKEVWENDKPTGRTGADGMPGLDYLSNIECYQFRDSLSGQFVLRMSKSTMNSEILGREGSAQFDTKKGAHRWISSPDEFVDDEICFQSIAVATYPESSWSDWE